MDNSENVKYLGVFFDSKMNWKTNFNCCLKAKKVFLTCRSVIGKTWGLSSKVIYCINRMIICPVISHSYVVWWTRVKLESAERKLTKL